MRAYSKVSPRLWTGRVGRAIRGDGITQAVYNYLTHGPHCNMTGLFYCPPAYIATDTGHPLGEPFRSPSEALAKPLPSPCEGLEDPFPRGVSTIFEALFRLEHLGFCRLDSDNDRIWVIGALEHEFKGGINPKDNNVIAARKTLAEHHNSFLLRMLLDEYPEMQTEELRELRDRYEKPFRSPSEALPKPLPSPSEALAKPLPRGLSQEQEQEQEIEQEQEQEIYIPPSPLPEDRGASAAESDFDPQQQKRKYRKLNYTPDFDSVYKIWRRPGGKGDAFKAWKQMEVDRPSTDVIISKIHEMQDKHSQWRDSRFQPLLGTWLRRGGWDDVPLSNGGSAHTSNRRVHADIASQDRLYYDQPDSPEELR